MACHRTAGAGFLGSLLLRGCHFAACGSCTVGLRPGRFLRSSSGYTLQRAIPSARTRFAPPSPLRLRHAGLRNIDRHVHPPDRLPVGVRSRLTLNRLALFRNPCLFGEGGFAPLCRYLYLHLLFRSLQQVSAVCLRRGGMFPSTNPSSMDSTSSAPDLCPIIIHAGPLD